MDRAQAPCQFARVGQAGDAKPCSVKSLRQLAQPAVIIDNEYVVRSAHGRNIPERGWPDGPAYMRLLIIAASGKALNRPLQSGGPGPIAGKWASYTTPR